MVKVKAHDSIWDNELADKLAKKALTGDRILTKDFRNENSYRLSWYSIKVEQNNRSFIKLINKVNKEIDEKKLKRMSNQHIDYDKKLSYRILNLDNEKINHTQNNQLEETSREVLKILSKFLSLKGNKYKSWKFKKLIGELPTIKKLKIRMPKLYKKDLNCPRCRLREENTKHIWECVKSNNDLILLERENKEWIHELVHNYNNFQSKDELLDDIYKFTCAEVTLKEYNTEVNTKFYRDNGYFNKRRTYIWDQQGSLDDLLIGWIPKKLRDIFTKYQIKKKMKDINSIIVEWINKINKFFYEKIWKTRNNEVNKWEKQNSISNVKKRKRNQN